MTTPTFRGSELDTFATCHHKFACDLLARCPAKSRKQKRDWLLAYCCPEGADWILANCSVKPIVQLNRMTEIGSRFHQFAFAYGMHLRREGKRSDWEAADLIAKGLATVDGTFVPQIYNTAVYWYQTFEHDPRPLVDDGSVGLTSGSFEHGHQIRLPFGAGEVVYVMHPDFANLSADLTRLEVWDWKSGMRSATYDPEKPDKQLLRYAWAFTKLFPAISHITLNLWFVNPKHPLSGEPLTWDFDVDEIEMPDGMVLEPVAAIRAMTEFQPSAGCWLCGGFCDWVSGCPDLPGLEAVLALTPEDALEAWNLREALGAETKRINAKRAALKSMVDGYVKVNGPLVLGQTEAGGLISYGPVQQVSAQVTDMAALVADVAAARPDLLRSFKLESVTAFAAAAGYADPFGGEGLLAGIKVKTRVTRGLIVEGEQDEEEGELEAPEE